MFSFFCGGLIQVAVGFAGGSGRFLTKRSGFERFGILDAAEALWELRLVFHGFEVAFRERIVVGSVRPAVGFGDAEISEEERRFIVSDRSAAIVMQGELACRGGMLRGVVI